VTDPRSAEVDPGRRGDEDLVELVPMLRRVVGARVKDPHTLDDLVQETLLRVMAARSRVEPDKLPHYAAVTARNLVASMAAKNDRDRARAHLLVEVDSAESPASDLLVAEERSIVGAALANLPAADRDLLLAHEVDGQGTASIASGRRSTPGAVAARLNRARAKLRIEYLLVAEHIEPPSDRCRPVLQSISGGDRRRQDELDASGHVLRCPACAHVRSLLFELRDKPRREGGVRVPIERDADVVAARQRGREAAAAVGFSSTDLTLIATAISEVSRNIVKFADQGEVVITEMTERPRGVHIVARDAGPGIDDPARAMQDGFSTYHGLGLGLPGAKRLMDRFELVSTPGQGTTVTMEKWLP
jgi:RNA polymerase sigma factor (sigma-70 family)